MKNALECSDGSYSLQQFWKARDINIKMWQYRKFHKEMNVKRKI